MTDSRKHFVRAGADERRRELIAATLDLIAEQGLASATVRAIAERANVTQGLIRHYFRSKEELIAEAFETHMVAMTNATESGACTETTTAVARLREFVRSSLLPPVVDQHEMAIWAGFMSVAPRDPRMRMTHEQTYLHFRDRLETLIRDACTEREIATSDAQLRRKAIACNAIIDGLWLEGGALPAVFAENELPEIGLESVAAIVGLDLNVESTHP